MLARRIIRSHGNLVGPVRQWVVGPEADCERCHILGGGAR